jgi:hypothetical protein
MLIGLGVDPELGQDRLDLRGKGADQVDPGRLAVTAAAGGLAVEGQVGGVVGPEPATDPPADPRLEVGGVDPAEDPRVGGLAEPQVAVKPRSMRNSRPRSLPYWTMAS